MRRLLRRYAAKGRREQRRLITPMAAATAAATCAVNQRVHGERSGIIPCGDSIVDACFQRGAADEDGGKVLLCDTGDQLRAVFIHQGYCRARALFANCQYAGAAALKKSLAVRYIAMFQTAPNLNQCR